MWTSPKKSTSSDQRPPFANTAEAFCAHIEGAATTDRVTFVRVCFVLISRLLSEVIELPEISLESDGEEIRDDRYDTILQGLKVQFAENNYYTMMFEAFGIAAEPAVGSISDDLADMWRELKSGLESLQQGRLENAVAQWRSSFGNGWGDQATQVLRPLVTLIFKDEHVEEPTQ